MGRAGYMNIKEAAARYEVSRSKLHRLIQLGRLRITGDPRDERVTMLRIEDLETQFRFPIEEIVETRYQTRKVEAPMPVGRITEEWCNRADTLRMRISGGRRLPGDSAEIIRQERESRDRAVNQAEFGGAESVKDAD